MVKKQNTDDLQQQIVELTADLQRVHADFVNFKRRADDDQQRLGQMAKVGVITQLLPLLDNIERALSHMPADLADNDWAKGVAQLAKQFQSALKNLGVERIPALGQPFDPNLHEAIQMEEGDGGGQEIVTQELQPGYRLDDYVIRHSVVKVGKK